MNIALESKTRGPAAPLRAGEPIPSLKNGAKMDADEFLKIYETWPEKRRAELINGVVHIMFTLVSAQWHSAPDGLLQGWLTNYAIDTPDVESLPNATVRVGEKNVPQPDGALRLLPSRGGKTQLDKNGMLVGPVELAVEVAASSAALDLGKRLKAYRDSGIQEYLVWCTKKESVHWFYLENGEYVPLQPRKNGILCSRVFPGLWLDTKALLRRDGKGVMTVLKRGLKSAAHKRFVKGK